MQSFARGIITLKTLNSVCTIANPLDSIEYLSFFIQFSSKLSVLPANIKMVKSFGKIADELSSFKITFKQRVEKNRIALNGKRTISEENTKKNITTTFSVQYKNHFQWKLHSIIH